MGPWSPFLVFFISLHIYAEGSRNRTNVCTSKDCNETASLILNSMNKDVDPCDDFYDYACGRWDYSPPPSKDPLIYPEIWHILNVAIATVHSRVKALLLEPQQPRDLDAVVEAKLFLQSCINETVITKGGIQPLGKIFDSLGGWPVVVGDTWNSSTLVLEDLMASASLYGASVFIGLLVEKDENNPMTAFIKFSTPRSEMTDRKEKFAAVAQMFGATEETVREDFNSMLLFEGELLLLDEPEKMDNDSSNTNMTVEELGLEIPLFDWLRYLQGVFNKTGVIISDQDRVVIDDLNHLKHIVTVINNTDPRIVVNYLFWHFFLFYNLHLSNTNHTTASNDTTNTTDNVTEVVDDTTLYLSPDCVWHTVVSFPWAVERIYVDKYINLDTQSQVRTIFNFVKSSMRNLVSNSQLYDFKGKYVAIKKVMAITVGISHSDFLLDDDRVNKDLTGIAFNTSTFLEKLILFIKRHTLTYYSELSKMSPSKTGWEAIFSIFTDRVAEFSSDTVFVTAGSLQPPLFSQDQPMYINFALTGSLIAQVMSKFFDSEGRKFFNGTKQNMWSQKEDDRFNKTNKCIEEQFSNITEFNLNVYSKEGAQKFFSDIHMADVAYRGYQNWLKNTFKKVKEPELPGLGNFTLEQLFLLVQAQLHCTLRTQKSVHDTINLSGFIPLKSRLNALMQNSDIFSRAFNCPRNSYMNPSTKCSVW